MAGPPSAVVGVRRRRRRRGRRAPGPPAGAVGLADGRRVGDSVVVGAAGRGSSALPVAALGGVGLSVGVAVSLGSVTLPPERRVGSAVALGCGRGGRGCAGATGLRRPARNRSWAALDGVDQVAAVLPGISTTMLLAALVVDLGLGDAGAVDALVDDARGLLEVRGVGRRPSAVRRDPGAALRGRGPSSGFQGRRGPPGRTATPTADEEDDQPAPGRARACLPCSALLGRRRRRVGPRRRARPARRRTARRAVVDHRGHGRAGDLDDDAGRDLELTSRRPTSERRRRCPRSA